VTRVPAWLVAVAFLAALLVAFALGLLVPPYLGPLLDLAPGVAP
jgi:hypothetical protein